MRFRLQIDTGKLRSLWGDSLGDSLWVRQFNSWKHADLGEIAGTVQLPVDSAGFVVEARAMQDGRRVQQVLPAGSRSFMLENLPEGPWRLRVMVDVNRNGRWDTGRSLPFRFAEPIVLYPDTVNVRKRWTTEGIVIKP
jgi:hypothetical protein